MNDLRSTNDLQELEWDAAGLVTVVAQDRHTGQVRMVAHANREALVRTLETGQAWFFSRSRGALWRKGESSGHTMDVHEVWVDCDGDALVYLVDPHGPSCHTGRLACFFRTLRPDGKLDDDGSHAQPALEQLWHRLGLRARADAAASYTRSLLEAGPTAIAAKIREEGGELGRALEAETDERVLSEAADVVYHVCVGLLARGLAWRGVPAELARRFGRSGHEEKATRPAG